MEAEGIPPEAIGRFLAKFFEDRNPKARYAFVLGRFQNWTIPKLLPDLWLDFVLGRMMRLNSHS